MRFLFLIPCLVFLTAHAYTVTGNSWAAKEITYSYDSEVPGYARPVFEASVKQWQVTALRSSVKFKEVADAGMLQISWTASPLQIGGLYAHGATTVSATNHIITGAHIILDGSINWQKDAPFGDTLASLTLHELGHVLGLGHSSAVLSVMREANVNVLLQRDDVDGIAAIYVLPPSDLDLFLSTCDRLGLAHDLVVKPKFPYVLRNVVAAWNGYTVIQVGANAHYFDPQTGTYIGLLAKGKFAIKYQKS